MNIHLPEPIYARLPHIYVSLAILLAFTPLGSVKWLVIIGLLTAVCIVTRWRKIAREEEQARTAAAIMEKYRKQRRGPAAADSTDAYEL